MHGLVKIQISAPPHPHPTARDRASGDGFLSLPARVSSEAPPERGKQEAATQAGSSRFLLSAPFEGEKRTTLRTTHLAGRFTAAARAWLQPADARLTERRTAHNAEQLGPGCQCFWNSALVRTGGHQLQEHFATRESFWKRRLRSQGAFQTLASLSACLASDGDLKAGKAEVKCVRRRPPQRISGRFVEPGTVAAETLSG